MEKNKNAGFTLIEVLLSLLLLLTITSLLPLVIKTLPAFDHSQNLQTLELELFFNQLAMEIREAEQLNVVPLTSFRLTLRNANGYLIIIERYGYRVRRRVDGLGHDVMLQRIKQIHFELVNHGVIVTVEDHQGRIYSRRFSKYYAEI